jgi:hypothetical protein
MHRSSHPASSPLVMLSSMRMFSPLLTPPYLLTSIPSLNLIMSTYLLFPYPLPCHARPGCLRLRHTQPGRLRQAWPCCLCPCHARPRCLCLCCTRPRRLRLRHVWPRLSDHFRLASSIPPASISGVRGLVFSDETLCGPAHSRDEPPVHPPVAIHHDLCHIHLMVT